MNIVVGITGGIAAYKAVGVVRAFVLAGHDVQVVATDAALRFVGRPTLEAISRNPVHTDLYEGVAEVRHVAIGQAADLIVIAPATANTIAKLATGQADDLLGNTVLASRAPLVIAPAMHSEMWENAATIANVATLQERGVTIVGPANGQLTGSDAGIGRMAEPEDIVSEALAVLSNRDAPMGRGDLAGRRILITAGGTREPLDPVRFIGNRSTGRQGLALAQAAAERGAQVQLIVANIEVDLPTTASIITTRVSTTAELHAAVTRIASESDAVIMAAAVADYRPESIAPRKIKKDDHGDALSLTLVRNPDILAEISTSRRPEQTIVGFAAETESDPGALLELGRAKIARKGCDYLVLNTVGWSDGFGTSGNAVTVINGAGDTVFEAAGSKREISDRILDLLA